MCTRCFEWCVEVIFYHPTVKLHLCFQHQLLCFMGWLQQMCVRPSFHLNPSISVLAFLCCPSVPILTLNPFLYPFSPTITCLFFSSFLFLTLEENSFVVLDHSGILSTEFVSLLEETEFTILIDAYPAPKVMWLKDNKAIPENYYVLTKTSHLEGNR